MSDDIRAIAQAFALAKKEFLSLGRSGTNSHQKYSYATIDDIYNAVESALMKNNIIIWHFADVADGGAEVLQTRLVHTTTGQYIQDRRYLVSEKPGNQGKGAANTYMKKYAVLSLCAISAGDDDDAAEEERYIVKKSLEPTISSEQLKVIQDEIKSCQNGKILYGNLLGYNKIRDLTELKASSFGSVMSYIANNKGQNGIDK
jgi:hypothetical protein